MRIKVLLIQILMGLSIISMKAQIQITVNPAQEIKEISPYIYGRNNSLSDAPSSPTSAKSWQLYKDAGVTFFRESGGNNSTKYNWMRKLSSHPDWYNNVYAHDWDYAAQSLQANMPNAKGMWAFQLLGYVAKTNAYNFNDWGYNQSQWWSGVNNNWCGGGGPTTGAGNPNLYLEQWPADSTVAILSQWFDKLGLNKDQFQYWNMDNEPECWNSTHDDIMPNAIAAEDYIQKYVAVATKVRALFPEIKIVGPVSTNEWQWYNWQNGDAVPDPQNPSIKYPWLQYFIKRIAEIEQQTGVRLLDVLDIHFYPNVDQNTTLQMYRVFYDTTYDFPGANGVHRVNGGWDTGISKEYIFKRCNDWLTQYMGANNGVTMGLSELGSLYTQDPNVVAVGYASLLGTFAQNNVELFSPWEWDIGQWEVLHLFTHYTGTTAINSTSSSDNLVSAYSSLNAAKDTISVVLVNRDAANAQSVNISFGNKTLPNETVSCYQLYSLPSTETFVSATQNALKKSEVSVNNNSIALSLPKLSVTAIQIPMTTTINVTGIVLDNTNASLSTNNTLQLTATTQPANATDTNVTWSSSDPAVATVSAAGLVTALSAGTAVITVTTEDGGFTATCTVEVSKQDVTVNTDETQINSGSTGTMVLSLTVPSNSLFSGSFLLTFPAGIQLNVDSTHLVSGLDSRLSLSIAPETETSWLFTIAPLPLRSSTADMTYTQIVEISYVIDQTVAAGKYQAAINDLLFEFDNGTAIDETILPVTITVSAPTGIQELSGETFAYMNNGWLLIQSPVAETIQVYSTDGVLLYNFQKQAGNAKFLIKQLKNTILIVKGSSGWVEKVVC